MDEDYGLSFIPHSASIAGRLVAMWDLSHLADDMVLAVSELATNSIVHAKSPFAVSLSSANGLVEPVVKDGSALPAIHQEPDSLDEGGRGLMIVGALSHQWGTSIDEQGLKSVWASFLERAQ